MQNVKIPTSDSYHTSKIERLKDPEYAAAYLTAILEEKDPEPELLVWAIKDVIEARMAINNFSQEDKLNWEKQE
jgi:DNA-binding phage protein